VASSARQGILPFIVKGFGCEDVTAHAGLPLVLETAHALGVEESVESHLDIAKRQRGFSEYEKLEALILLTAAGGERIEDIRILSDDKALLRLLDRPSLPSPDALLELLKAFDNPTAWEAKPADELSFVPQESEPLLGLHAVNRDLVRRIVEQRQPKVATIDHDGTIIESHKHDAKMAYEGTRGFQPLVALWAEEDLVVADEFRDANVPGGKDPLSSVKKAFEALPASVSTRFFRADSAAYYQPLLKWLVKEDISFCISADMTRELKQACVDLPLEAWSRMEERSKELVDLAEVEFAPGDWHKDSLPLRYVAIRFTPRQVDALVEPHIRHHAVVTNRPLDAITKEALVTWHREKAGSIEHCHRVMKDELAAGVLPSAKFGANAAWFRINAITYNLLTALKRMALPARFHSARPKRLRFEIFTIPGRVSLHQSQLGVTLAASDERVQEIVHARQALLLARDRAQAPASLH
jgi:hypothetical protein